MIGNVPKHGGAFERPFPPNQPIPPHLAYVYGQVMYGGRGVVGFDHDTDCLILYLKLQPKDQDRAILKDIDEIWIALKRRE